MLQNSLFVLIVKQIELNVFLLRKKDLRAFEYL